MQSLQYILLTNAAAAAVLAAVVWVVCCVCRRPAVARALWILVLLKLVTPPLVNIPVNKWIAPHQATGLAPVPALTGQPEETPPEIAIVSTVPAPAPQPPVRSWTQRTLSSLAVVWAFGSLLFLAVGLVRVIMLMRLLADAPLAPDSVQQLTKAVAARFGIRKPPVACVVPGVVCPALWAFARTPRVIIPLNLWNRLDDQMRRTLLAHELAHLRRGDHWVRLLEFVAGVVYWWHPAVWAARRQIHDYEEQCCDAWVLWAMPASAHSYGSALLEAVDFVSATRPMRPALSAGLGEFRHLKRRLLMIKHGTVSRMMSRTSLAAVLGAAALALPFTPGFAQETAPQALPGMPPAPAAENAPQASPEVTEARARVQRLQRELAEARSRLAVLERGSAPAGGTAVEGRIGYGTATISSGSGYGGVVALTPPRAPAAPSAGTSAIGGGAAYVAAAPAMPGAMSSAAPSPTPSGMGSMGAGGMAGTASVGMAPPRAGARSAPAGADAERRLQTLEDQLRALMDQVRDLRDLQERQHQDRGRQGEDPTRPGR